MASPSFKGKPPGSGGGKPDKPNNGDLVVTEPRDVPAFTGGTVGSGSTPPPVLTLLTGAGDNTPNFNLTGDSQIGDIVRFQWDNVSTFTSGALAQATNTIDATESAALALDFATGALANRTWYFRARIERGAVNYGWSNIVSLTISQARRLDEIVSRETIN